MSGETKLGTPWRDDELDEIVADYFSMLALDISGQPYVKSKHSAVLMSRIGRSHRSVEFKHQNISAVLDEMGMPWIPGYKPKTNYQSAIFDAIDRYLTVHQAAIELTQRASPPSLVQTEVFVPAPALSVPSDPVPARLKRLVRKFDPVERDHRNRSLGKAGESFVFDLERRKLANADRPDLAEKVRWIAAEDGDGAGYDILSFTRDGHERLIEVKTTNGSARTPFFMTRNECGLAAERATDWRIYRVHLFAQMPRIFKIVPPLQNAVRLTAETWRASF